MSLAWTRRRRASLVRTAPPTSFTSRPRPSCPLGTSPSTWSSLRLVLHHLIDQVPLDQVFAEARRVLKPGGRLIAMEPNLYHPIGFLLFCANHLGWSKKIMGTSDDWPLLPRAIRQQLGRLGFSTRVLGVEFAWRRLPIPAQRVLNCLDAVGSLPGLNYAAHTFLLVATKGGGIPGHAGSSALASGSSSTASG